MKETKLLIFDLDGTLVDSHKDIIDSLMYCYEQLGVGPIEESTLRPLIGKPLADVFYATLPEAMHAQVPACVKRFRSYYYEHCLDNTRPYPGVPELLKELHDSGFLMAVATTKRTFMAKKVVQELHLAGYFHLVQGTDELPAKPDPAILLSVCRQLDQPVTAAMMIGDTNNDILAAQRAGMKNCAVSWGSWSREQLAQLNPDYIVDELPQLLHVLQPGVYRTT